jgi:hypothetical protein
VVTRWRDERGKGRIGCLVVVLLLALVVYAVKDFGAVYWRYYQIQDTVKSQASFAPGLTDQAIRDRLVAECDTLGIPLGPKQWQIKRTKGEITISATYADSVIVDLPGWRRVFHFRFTPHAGADL